MTRGPSVRRARNALLAVVAVSAVAFIATPATGQTDPSPGSAGIDTSLPATDSQVTASGSGPFADLRVTVNQTSDLVNQAVSITWTGGVPTTKGSSRFDGHYLQIMQCWGDPDGTHPENPGPPPEQCVQGATDAVYGGRNLGIFPAGGYALERIVSRRDFPNFDPAAGFVEDTTGYSWMPFRAVGGAVVNSHYDPTFNPAIVGGSYWLNPYFNAITTNEIAGGRTRSNGTGAELFEVTTGLESSGLGCGQQVQPLPSGGLRVPRCWIVIVPRGDPEQENDGTPFSASSGTFTSPLSPAAWEHRIAVPLDFNPIDTSCELSDDQLRIAGNELPVPAVSSWQQELCATPGLPPFAYGTIGDAGARQQLLSGVAGAPGMVAVARPVDASALDAANPVVYAPISVSGVVIGFNVERNPVPERNAAEEALRGIRVAELNLTPRLVAKLLTQSYRQQTAIKSQPDYAWVVDNPAHLGLDPDFVQFNPEFELLQTASGKNFGGLVMPSRNSDGAQQVWGWVLADPEARAWLAGEPDPFGMQVNPLYATTAVANSTGVAFADPAPDLFPKSDPYCYQAAPRGPGGAIVPPPLCGTDWLPYTQSFRDAARLTRLADDGARTSEDPSAASADRVYRPDGPQTLGSRTMLALTDSASAHQYGVQTARLSRAGDDGADRSFIAPDEAGLTAGVEGMAAKLVPTVLEPDPLADAPAAYPLTALTYAATTPLSLDQAARDDYAAFVEYATGPGQVSGRELGQLPPGYAPLPPLLRTQAAAAAKAIREMQPAASPPVTPTASPPIDSGLPSGGTDGGALTEPGGVDPGGTPPSVAPTPPQDSASLLATPILALARNRLVLPALAIIALLSGLGALEITKRPRRLSRGTPSSAGGDR